MANLMYFSKNQSARMGDGCTFKERRVVIVQFRGKDFGIYVMSYLFGVQFY